MKSEFDRARLQLEGGVELHLSERQTTEHEANSRGQALFLISPSYLPLGGQTRDGCEG